MKGKIRSLGWAMVVALAAAVLLISTATWAQKSKPVKPPVTPPDPAIAFTAWYGSGDHKDVIVVNADGTNKTAVLSNREAHYNWPDWSPDGKQLVARGGVGTIGIEIVNVDGTGLARIISPLDWGPVAWSPVPLGPDQKHKIAFTDRAPEPGREDHDLFLINVDGSDLQRLTNTPDVNESPFAGYCNISWSFDGQYIAAAAYDDIIIYRIECDGSRVFSATSLGGIIPYGNPGIEIMEIDWANTQYKLVIMAGWYDLYVVDVFNPANIVQLTSTSIREMGPSWSPDDSQIAYINGGLGVWVMNSDGTGAHRIVAPQSRVIYERTQWRRNF
jgi:Tol biopolymer transport system component